MRIWIPAALAALVVIATPTAARADLGLGLFIGEPLGLDVKIDLSRRQSLDIVLGATSVRSYDYSYGHLTYLLTPFVASGRSVVIPLRLGIGAAVFGVVEGNVGLAGRVPFQLGFMFRNAPLEIYLEIALKVTFFEDNDTDNNDDFGARTDVDGGIGIRFYF